jgi:hypothetical protein
MYFVQRPLNVKLPKKRICVAFKQTQAPAASEDATRCQLSGATTESILSTERNWRAQGDIVSRAELLERFWMSGIVSPRKRRPA